MCSLNNPFLAFGFALASLALAFWCLWRDWKLALGVMVVCIAFCGFMSHLVQPCLDARVSLNR